MVRKNPVSHENPSHQTSLRRSPRFLLPSRIENGKSPSSNMNQVRSPRISSVDNNHSIEEISIKKSDNRRRSIRLINCIDGLKKSASVGGAIMLPRSSGPKVALINATEKTQFENRGFSEKRVVSESGANTEGDCWNGRRRSLRLLGFKMAVEDLSSSLAERISSKVAWERSGRKQRTRSLRFICLEKGGEQIHNFSEKRVSSDVTQKGDCRNERRKSCRLMGAEKASENISDSLEKRIYPEVTQKRVVSNELRRSLRLMGSEKQVQDFLNKQTLPEVKRKGGIQKERRHCLRLMGSAESVESDFLNKRRSSLRFMDSAGSVENQHKFSEKCVSSGATQKRDPQEERRSSLRLMVFSNGAQKREVAVDGNEELEREINKEVKMGNPVITPTPEGTPREGTDKKRRKLESGNNSIGVADRGNMEESGFQCWTKDQEAALQKAYFAAKPSPHFWKKVSKLVPGKSAQECFDKIHANHETPQFQPRSRSHKSNWSPLGQFTLSSSRLLGKIDPDVKRVRRSKPKRLAAQKTVRNMLRKHHIVDQGYETDLFSVLETTTNVSILDLSQSKMPSTPDCVLKPLGILQKCQEQLSSAHNKTLSKSEITSPTDFTSPPVLKRVKNMALHEKYIDRLHSREARRKRLTSTLNTGSVAVYDHTKGRGTQHKDVKAAKTALISDAMDVIKQFKDMQSFDEGDYQYFGDEDDDVDGSDEEHECSPYQVSQLGAL